MCLDSLNWAQWVRFLDRYWYQSFIDGSNIWGVDRTDPWGPEMDHPPLGRSYLVVESSCYMVLIIVTRKRNGSAAAKYELYILLPAEQRCSKKCVAALQADTFVYLYIYIQYIYIYCDYYSYDYVSICFTILTPERTERLNVPFTQLASCYDIKARINNHTILLWRMYLFVYDFNDRLVKLLFTAVEIFVWITLHSWCECDYLAIIYTQYWFW